MYIGRYGVSTDNEKKSNDNDYKKKTLFKYHTFKITVLMINSNRCHYFKLYFYSFNFKMIPLHGKGNDASSPLAGCARGVTKVRTGEVGCAGKSFGHRTLSLSLLLIRRLE